MSKKYIEADALMDKMWQVCGVEDAESEKGRVKWDSGLWLRYKVVEETVSKIPAADVRENVSGEWEWRYDDENGRPVYGCSYCNGMVGDAENKEYVFCPYCGADNRPTTTSADMRGEENDNN